MSLRYVIQVSLCLALFFVLVPAYAQLDFSQGKEFFLENDSIKMRLIVKEKAYKPERRQGIFWDFEKGFNSFFAFYKNSTKDVLDVLDERWETSPGKDGRPTKRPFSPDLVFFNVMELDAILSEENWCIHASEVKRAGYKEMNKPAFKKGCKELFLGALGLKEIPCNVESFRWKINKKELEKKASLQFDQALNTFTCSKKIKKQMLFLEDARVKDVLAFIENRYYKRITVAYEKGHHPIWLGNYRFPKMKFPLDYSFVDFSQYLTRKYGIELQADYGAFKGKAYSPETFKEEDQVKFEDYEVYDYQDDYIKVRLRFLGRNQVDLNGKALMVNYDEVYLGAEVRTTKALEYLHYGIIRTGERTIQLNKEKEETLFFQLLPYGQNVEIAAENLAPDEIEEEDFRRRVEKVFLDKIGVEKKTIDATVYQCTYQFNKIKNLDNFSVIDTKDGYSMKYEMNYRNRDSLNWHFLFPPDPKLLVTLRIHGYDLLFKQNDWSNYNPPLAAGTGIDQSMEYKLSDIALPRNDLDNLIFILDKKYGISIVKTDKKKPVILYETKN